MAEASFDPKMPESDSAGLMASDDHGWRLSEHDVARIEASLDSAQWLRSSRGHLEEGIEAAIRLGIVVPAEPGVPMIAMTPERVDALYEAYKTADCTTRQLDALLEMVGEARGAEASK